MSTKTKSTRKPSKVELLNKKIDRQRLVSYESLIDDLPALIAKHPRIEHEIVHNYLSRNGYRVTSK